MALIAAASQQDGRPANSDSLADVLHRICGAGHDSLLPADSMARVDQIAGLLPAALGRWSYLECRLLDASSVDLVCLVDREAAAALLSRAQTDIDSPLFSRPVWRAVRRLMRRWVDRTDWWADAVDHLWLEFDTGSGATPDPGVFICFGEQRPHGYRRQEQRPLLHATASALCGSATAEVYDALDRFLETLPESAYIPYVGAMLQRAAPTLRLCVTRCAAVALTHTLHQADSQPVREHADMLQELLPVITALRDPGPANRASMLHVDIGADGLDARIGIEFGCSRLPQLRGVLPDSRYRAWLVDRGWCSPALHDGLAQWPGRGLALMSNRRRPHRTARMVNHTKLVLDRLQSPHMKAYLALTHWPVGAYTA
jgi:hypothetical protein